MIQFLINRFVGIVVVTLGVMTLVFFSLHIVPGDPVEVMLGDNSSFVDREQLRHSMGLDKPIWVQYREYMSGLFQGDLGQSIHRKKEVNKIIGARLWETVRLALISMLIALSIALPLGIWAAKNPGKWQDKLSLVLSLSGVSLPNFVLGPILVLIFSLALHWLPTGGSEEVNSWVLPAFALGTAMAAMLSRMLRASLLDVSSELFVVTAQAKGLSQDACWNKHILPNALLPVLTVLGLQFGTLLGGAVIVELVFSWNGIGSLLVEAVEQRDYPLVQGCMLVISLSYVMVNMLIDVLYGVVDPRVR